MNALTSLLVAEHLNDLMQEADANRRVKLLDGARNTRVPAWRRLVARSARGASVAFGAVATRLEPTDAGQSQHRTDDRTPAMSA
jgi:hypothetical protein